MWARGRGVWNLLAARRAVDRRHGYALSLAPVGVRVCPPVPAESSVSRCRSDRYGPDNPPAAESLSRLSDAWVNPPGAAYVAGGRSPAAGGGGCRGLPLASVAHRSEGPRGPAAPERPVATNRAGQRLREAACGGHPVPRLRRGLGMLAHNLAKPPVFCPRLRCKGRRSQGLRRQGGFAKSVPSFGQTPLAKRPTAPFRGPDHEAAWGSEGGGKTAADAESRSGAPGHAAGCGRYRHALESVASRRPFSYPVWLP
jgi:hypothetical protein